MRASKGYSVSRDAEVHQSLGVWMFHALLMLLSSAGFAIHLRLHIVQNFTC